MNEHAFLPGEFTRVKIGPRWRLWAHVALNDAAESFQVVAGSIALVVCVVKDVCLSGDVEDEKYDYAYVVVEGRHAFMKTVRLEPA